MRIRGEPNINIGNKAFSIGEILKPPPPPPSINNIRPVPFHGGGGRIQRQNIDIGYQYPPPPPPPPLPPSVNFKFPSPFYRQYNFNFVPPPQPFTTTPSPTIFQKVSNWLFPSGPSPQDGINQLTNVPPIKKDCNPCNLVPWIPVIRYDLSGKKLQQSSYPTYGPPSPTAVTNADQTGYHYPAQPLPQFNVNQNFPTTGGKPHAIYGPPPSYVATPSSTYGPPSPTHTLPIVSSGPPTSTHLSSTYSFSSSSYGVSSSSYGTPSSTYNPLSSSYGSPPQESTGLDSNFRPVTPDYDTSVPNYEPPLNSNVEIINNNQLSTEITLPKVSHPTGFKNSYGEPITNNFPINIPYPVSATAAESTKVRTEVLPNIQNQNGNETFSVAKPSPFSINKGRNIHTLQPVALPNLSVSPLPPIFNARPFRPNTKIYLNNLHGINNLQQNFNSGDESQSLDELTHSINYSPNYVHTSNFDLKNLNKSKSYRKIPTYSEDYSHDVSSQASEDYVAATKTNNEISESSFESTGPEFENDLYDHNIPLDFRKSVFPQNHRPHFTDLRGISDEVVDKFRTDNNLQSIDSPLLYLRPSAPHKDFDNFVTPLSTPLSNNDYEIYDDISSTVPPELSTANELWNKVKSPDLNQGLVPPPLTQENKNKPKVVQIIIPYTTSNNDITNEDSVSQDWISASADESQGRKVPTQTIYYSDYNTVTENIPLTDSPDQITVTESTESLQYNTQAILNDLYDVKEPPFDIIKFQHNIDDWTEQEYAKQPRTSDKTHSNGKYAHAKQIPDEYFTTTSPTTYDTNQNNYNHNYNFYDYEGSSSIQHIVRDDSLNKSFSDIKSIKHYNNIERQKVKSDDSKKFNIDDILKPHIYTASSSFRTTTTTPAPWEKIQTSISPLTKEKIYVVTSKPWPDKPNITTWYSGIPFESKKTTTLDNDVSASDNLPFKSPRFLNRPSFPSDPGTAESLKDSSYSFSKIWHKRSK